MTDPSPSPAPPEELFDADTLEAARVLFAREVSFLMGAAKIEQLPGTDLPEVAFAGRSNVGKSSLINALTGRKALARASSEPGRTREVNIFLLDARLRLVDLPGYGFAKADKKTTSKFQNLGRAYLRGRPNLKRVYLLIDARHGLKAVDKEAMEALDLAAVSFISLQAGFFPRVPDLHRRVGASRGHELSVRVMATAIDLVPVARQPSRGLAFSEVIDSCRTTFAAAQHVRLVVI